MIYGSTQEQRSRLLPKYILMFRNERSTRAFCHNSSLEEKEYVLAMLGIKSYHVFCDVSVKPKEISAILKQYKEGKSAAALRALAEKKIYIYSDKQIIDMMGKMSAGEQHPQYLFNVELRKTGYHIMKWSKKLNSGLQLESLAMEESVKVVMKYTLCVINTLDLCDSILQVGMNDMKILFYLYSKKHTFVQPKHLFDYFAGVLTKVAITHAIRRMKDEALIESSLIANKYEYTISGLGVDKVIRFVKYVVNIQNF